MLVYGWYSFKVKTINQYDVHLDIAWNGGCIEVRQKVFHLFWIPFFPIGKKWTFKGPAGEHYLHDSIAQQVKQQGVKIRTPFYSFSLLLLAGLIGIVAIAGNAWSGHQYKQRRDARFAKETKEMTASIGAIAPGNVLHFSGDYSGEGYDYRYCKVLAVNAKSIQVLTHAMPNSDDKDEINEIVDFLSDTLNDLDTVWIDKQKLIASLPANVDEEYQYKLESPFPNSTKHYKLADIYAAKGVELSMESSYCSSQDKEITLYFNNRGFPGRVKAIRNNKGDIAWTYNDDKYYTIPAKSGFRLSGTSSNPIVEYEFTIHTEDDYGNKTAFLIKGNCEDFTVTKVTK
ncbi:MAG: hypothetical protein FD123_2218 [Bacteroidetes bacterium]|nr:MAG: hypothetical protein FD123_2218 [Bacteroidota bacterium]